MKRNLFLTTVVIITTVLAFVFFPTQKENKREKHEAFILKGAQQINQMQSKVDAEHKAVDQPDMAAFQEFVSTVDPNLGYVPEKRLLTAYKQTRHMMAEQNITRDYDPLIEWEGTGANMGGRTRALMFDPNDENNTKVWAGGVTGGLWYIDNIASSSAQWQTVDDFWPNLAVSCMTFDPNETETMYVGTGEAQTARIIYRKSSGLGAGIYKTTDGGQTWNLMPSTEDFAYVTDIVVRDEEGVSVIYAGVVSGTYMGEDHESQPSDGLYRSDDGGDSWSQVLPIIAGIFDDKPYAPSDIEISANGRIFVGTMENLNKNGGACVLYSDTGLEGSWTVYDYYNTKIGNETTYKIPARTIVAAAPSNPNKVYAQFAAGYNNGFTYYRGRYMAMTGDGGENWAPINHPYHDEWATLAWHAFTLRVDPNDENEIFTGGLDLWKTANSGGTWKRVSDWSLMYDGGGDAYVHADQHNIQFMPNAEDKAVFSCDGGVFYSNTTMLTYPDFMERNNGYNTLQFYSCAIDPTPGADSYIGGLQDNGSLFYEGSPLEINDMISGGDGAFCFWDENDPDVFVTSVYYNRYYSFYNATLYGQTEASTGTFISPADYDFKRNTIYANGVGFTGGNANKILRVTGVPFTMNDQLVNIGTSGSAPFSHVKYSRYSPQGTSTIFVGTTSGKLYKIENMQATPSTTEIGSPDFPAASISCVAVGGGEDTLLVTFSNYGVSSVWQTFDGGQNWQEKENNLPDMPIRWAIYHPQNSGQALLATETGVWATNTLGEEETEWAPAVDGLANVRVDMLQLRHADNTVLAATHGRGLFTCEYNLDIYTGLNESELVSEIKLFPNPATDIVNIQINSNLYNSFDIQIFDVTGRLIKEASSKQKTYSLDVSAFNSGTYFAVINSGSTTIAKQSFIVK